MKIKKISVSIFADGSFEYLKFDKLIHNDEGFLISKLSQDINIDSGRIFSIKDGYSFLSSKLEK